MSSKGRQITDLPKAASPEKRLPTRSDHNSFALESLKLNEFLSINAFRAPELLIPSAWHEHAPFAFWLVEKLKPRVFVELGTHLGFSYFSFCQAIRMVGLDTIAFAVDRWTGDDHAGWYGEEVYQQVEAFNLERYADLSTLLKMEFEEARSYFEDGSIDLLHIDGRHYLEDVKVDFESWLPKLSDSAVVLFHDINVRDRGFGVHQFWSNVCKKYPQFSFVHGCGLGVLAVGRNCSPDIAGLFSVAADRALATAIREVYARLGGSVSLSFRAIEDTRIRKSMESSLAAVSEQVAKKERLRSHAEALLEQYRSEALVEKRRLEGLVELLRSNADASVNNLQKSLESSRQQIDLLGAERAALWRRVTDLLDQGRLRIVAENTADKLREDLRITLSQLSLHRQVAAERTATLRDLERDVLVAREERTKALAELGDFARMARGLPEDLTVLRTEISNLSSRLEERSTRVDRLEIELADAGSQLEDRSTRVDRLEIELADAGSQLEERSTQVKRLEIELADARREVLRLQAERVTAERHNEIALQNAKARIEAIGRSRVLRVAKPARWLVARMRRRSLRKLIVRSSLFDREWYLKTYIDVLNSGIDPAFHYLLHGAAEGRDPSLLFDSDWYLQQYPDVQAAGMNPLVHYLLRGAGEGRKPGPFFSSRPAGENADLRFVGRDVSCTSSHASARGRSQNGGSGAGKTGNQFRKMEVGILPGYLTLHPDLVPGPKLPLQASVSVIIPTYNGGIEFYWLLRKLKQQKGLRSLEIIIVDSGSGDATDVTAEELGCKVIRVPKTQFSHSVSRNRGAEEATGDMFLFMVQDAHPVGDYWLHGLASMLHAELVAVSCAEYSRCDSELLYDMLIDTHYRFLGCRSGDRLGRFISDSQVDLRKQGQLSNVACLIPGYVFKQYKFVGRYAEDLTLGIRLIRDGHRIAMVSSIPVIHAHRRPAGYYLRRVFADAIFLTAVFPDYVVPELLSLRGTLAVAFAFHKALPKVLGTVQLTPGNALRHTIARLGEMEFPSTRELLDGTDFGYPPFGQWVTRVAQKARDKDPTSVLQSMSIFKADYLARLSDLVPKLDAIYPMLDEHLASELDDAIEKTLTMTLGAQLAFHSLAAKSGASLDTETSLVLELESLLLEGV